MSAAEYVSRGVMSKFAMGSGISPAASAPLVRQSIDLLAQLLNETLGPGPDAAANHAAAYVSACHAIAQRSASPI